MKILEFIEMHDMLKLNNHPKKERNMDVFINRSGWILGIGKDSMSRADLAKKYNMSATNVDMIAYKCASAFERSLNALNEKAKGNIIIKEIDKHTIDRTIPTTEIAIEVLIAKIERGQGYNVRAENCLKNQGIRTIGQLLEKTEYDLIMIPNMGRKTINAIKLALSEMGLHIEKENTGGGI